MYLLFDVIINLSWQINFVTCTIFGAIGVFLYFCGPLGAVIVIFILMKTFQQNLMKYLRKLLYLLHGFMR